MIITRLNTKIKLFIIYTLDFDFDLVDGCGGSSYSSKSDLVAFFGLYLSLFFIIIQLNYNLFYKKKCSIFFTLSAPGILFSF